MDSDLKQGTVIDQYFKTDKQWLINGHDEAAQREITL